MDVVKELSNVHKKLEELLEYAEQNTSAEYVYSNITYYISGARDYVEDAKIYVTDKREELKQKLNRE